MSPAWLRALLVGLGLATLGCSAAVSAPAAVPRAATGAGQGVAAGVPYDEWITGGAQRDEALPLVVALHGHGGNASRFVAMFSGFSARARIVVPHGEPIGAGARYAWFSGTSAMGVAEEFSAAVGPAVERVAAAIAELQRTKPTKGLAIVTGFSQGGGLTMGLAARHPELVAAAFPMAGVLADGLQPSATGGPRPHVHAFVGRLDPRLDGVRRSVETLRQRGVDARVSEYEGVAHTMDPSEVAEVRAEIEAWTHRLGG